MLRVFARYDLPTSIRVTRGCLGKTFAARVADRRMRVSIPGWKQGDDAWRRPDGFAIIPPDVDLLPQSPNDRERLGDGGWGRVTEWRTDPPRFRTAWVSCLMMEFVLRDGLIERRAQQSGRWDPTGPEIDTLFEEIPAWFDNALVWIGAATGQDTLIDYPIHRRNWGEGLSLRALADDGPSGTTWPNRMEIQVSRPTPLTLAVLRRVIAMSSAARVPPDAHLFLRDARGELLRGRFRRSVIDAATSVELVLARLHSRHPFPGVNHPRPTLGLLVDHATVALPSDTRVGLVDRRNDAIHRGAQMGRETASRAVEIARQIVTQLEPLTMD